MGNWTSCASACSIPPSSPPQMEAPAPVSRVLLVDGSALNFTAPIKVINILLDHPFHVICPVDTLIPGHHSLSSLLPDEELQLGQLYLLLPLKTFENRKSMPMIPLIRSTGFEKSSKGLENRHISMPNMLRYYTTVADVNEGDGGDASCKHKKFLTLSHEEEASGEGARLLINAPKSDVGSSDLGSYGSASDVGSSDMQPQPQQRFSRQKRLMSMKTFSNTTNYKERPNWDVGSSGVGDYGREGDVGDSDLQKRRKEKRLTSMATFRNGGWYNSAMITREMMISNSNSKELNNNYDNGGLCDTPELQRAYRSAMLRCSSWTPRLQSITELNTSCHYQL